MCVCYLCVCVCVRVCVCVCVCVLPVCVCVCACYLCVSISSSSRCFLSLWTPDRCLPRILSERSFLVTSCRASHRDWRGIYIFKLHLKHFWFIWKKSGEISDKTFLILRKISKNVNIKKIWILSQNKTWNILKSLNVWNIFRKKKKDSQPFFPMIS